jgi:hypothetical protein
VLLGVVVDGALKTPAEALAAAAPDGWSSLPIDRVATAVRTWADGVLLAFDQPVGDAAFTATGNRIQLTRRVLRRGDGAGQSEDVAVTLTFGPDRTLAATDDEVQARWVTTMYVRRDKLTGVPESAVDRALTDHGRLVRQCFTDAWNADLALDGRVRLQWDVAGGKVGTVAVITEAGTNEDLARCYAGAVRAGTYPSEASGTVTWVFGIDRRQVAPM